MEDLFLSLVPWFWKTTPETELPKTVWVEYLKSIASGFDDLQVELYTTCNDLNDYLLPTGQHLSLEWRLNDLYDPVLRRIYITENDIPAVWQTWYLQGEDDPINKVWYLQGEFNPVPEIWYLQSETVNKNHFTINIPTSITFIEAVLRGQVDPYVVNGYNYNIVTF